MSASAGDAVMKAVKAGADPVETVKQAVQGLGGMEPQKRTYLPPSINDIRDKYATNLELRARALNSRIPFITPSLGRDFKLTQGLILMGGVSGQGKSTTFANLAAGYCDAVKDKPALIVTNEDNSGAAYDRIACIHLQISFPDYYNGKLTPEEMDMVQDQSRLLMSRVIVEEGSQKYDMTCLEDVQAVLIYLAESGCGLGMLDYFQTVTHSRNEPGLDPVQVSKRLGFFLKDYGRKVAIPLVVFAQLKPNSEGGQFKDRVENDRTIYNHAFVAIEVIPDFKTGMTKFHWHKDRFGGLQGKEVEMVYVGGRFVPVGGESL